MIFLFFLWFKFFSNKFGPFKVEILEGFQNNLGNGMGFLPVLVGRNNVPLYHVAGIKDLWSMMNISYDKFIRTTDDYHIKAVQDIFKRLYGWYIKMPPRALV